MASPGRVLMLVEHEVPSDPRVLNEARTIARELGAEVTVVGLRRKGPRVMHTDGVRLIRWREVSFFGSAKAGRRRTGFVSRLQFVLGYVFEYTYFTSAAFVSTVVELLRGRLRVIHTHNPPDTLFVSGLLGKLFGSRFVFDHHDLCPELYASRRASERGPIVRLLRLLEWLSLRSADLVIATNESYKRVEVARGGISNDRVVVVRNGPDLERVRAVAPDPEIRARARHILVYVGEMNPQDGVDYLLRALAILKDEMRREDFFAVLVGRGDELEVLRELAPRLGLENHVWLTGFIPDEDLIRYLSTADICLDPDPSNALNDKSTWIKIMEYMAMGKPIVSFDLSETRVSAGQAALYAAPNDEHEFAQHIVTLMDDPALRGRMGESGRRRVVEELSWDHTSRPLVDAYRRLLGCDSTSPLPACSEVD